MEIPQDEEHIFTLLMSDTGIKKMKMAFERAGILLPETSLTTEISRLQQDISYALLNATQANESTSNLAHTLDSILDKLDIAEEKLTDLKGTVASWAGGETGFRDIYNIRSRLDAIELHLKKSVSEKNND